MICLDLDGTLLDDDKQISAENRRAVREAYDQGIDIVLATGRQYRKAKELAHKLEVPVTVVGNNGTCIRSAKDDRRLHFNPMPQALLQELFEQSLRFGISPIVHVDRYEEGTDIVIAEDLCPSIQERYGLLDSDWVQVTRQWDDAVIRNAVSMVFFGSRTEITRWHTALSDHLLAPHVIHFMENLQKFEAMLEVLGDTGTKWHGIRLHAQAKKIRPEEIAAIGDDSNDLQMLTHAGYSFAPKNATQAVKNSARRVLDRTNNQDAVAYAIREVLA